MKQQRKRTPKVRIDMPSPTYHYWRVSISTKQLISANHQCIADELKREAERLLGEGLDIAAITERLQTKKKDLHVFAYQLLSDRLCLDVAE